MSRRPHPPRLLTIAGSDSGGGAGIQADLKTFAAHGGYGMSVVTAVTAQNTRAVTAVAEVPPEVVEAQIDAVFEDLGVDAVKIGMLSSAPLVRAVAAALGRWRERAGDAAAPVVLDPVMVAKSGATLLADDAVEALAGELAPLATLLTPNLPEAARLAGRDPAAGVPAAEREALAREIAVRTAPGTAVLLKGGHARPEDDPAGGAATVEDLLYEPAADRVSRFRHPRIATSSTHGTGCTLSAAIAARLGAGEPLGAAVEGGIGYLHGAIAAAYPLGGGHGPVDHLYRLSPREGR